MTPHPGGRRRRTTLGQALVEFALVGPLVLTSILACVDGGLLLWSNNAANYSAGVALTIVAQEGRSLTADTDAVQEIRQNGLGDTPAHIDEIDVYQLLPDANGGHTTQGPTNRYSEDGTLLAPIAWPTGGRVVTQGANLTYAGITIKYQYHYLGLVNTPSVHLSVSKFFRLEPLQ